MTNNMRSLIINNIKMENCIVNGDFEVPFFNTETETQDIKGLQGSTQTARNTNELRFEIPMTFHNKEGKTKNEIMSEITQYIDYDEPVTIRIEDEEWHWWGTVDGSINIKFFKHIYYDFILNVVLTDPFRYSADFFNNTAASDQLTVVNSGTAPAPFTLTATALKDAAYFAVTDENENHFLIGEDSEEEVIKDYSPSLLTSELKNSVGWTRMSANDSIPDRYLGGATGAALTQNPSGWALNLGSVTQTTGWRGFGYKRSFNRLAQNFKVKAKIFVRNSFNGSGKIGQFFYDDNNRLIFSIGYQDVHHTKDSGAIVAMAYNQAGEEKRLYHAEIPFYIKKMKDIVIYVTIERQGEAIKVRTWIYNELNDTTRNRPLNIREKTFQDKGKFYQRKIGSVAIGSFRGNGNYKLMNMLGTFNHELLDIPKGAADMFIKTGDMIVLDTRDDFITVNGEPYMVKKSFSSSFFKVSTGISALLISPEETFDTRIRWQDRFK